MIELPALPAAPPGVRYALTVPQSVLFADLSLRGSLREVFRRVFDIDYAPSFIAVDDGAMSWDFSPSDPFNRELVKYDGSTEEVVSRFIEACGRTSRSLTRIATVVSPSSRRRESSMQADLLHDLGAFWDAYEDHMATLYTFWNVENLLTESLIDALRDGGFSQEIADGLPTFIRPSERNWFSYEQSNLAVLQERFGDNQSEVVKRAAQDHVNTFGFLLAPFNVGNLPTANEALKRMASLKVSPTRIVDSPSMNNFPTDVQALGHLERQLSFWKTERLDAFALGDAIARPLYEDLAQYLQMPLYLVFSMTREEIERAIEGARPPLHVLETRNSGYCLALIDNSIDFYEPTHTDPISSSEHTVAASGQVLTGSSASPGQVRGRVHIVQPWEVPEFSDDEIIVTRMTRPEMGAALDIALAYVTDEGGMLSHAAIVSREKGKPCVVGLGNATELLRQGMFIDVDGTAGTVTVVDASFLESRE